MEKGTKYWLQNGDVLFMVGSCYAYSVSGLFSQEKRKREEEGEEAVEKRKRAEEELANQRYIIEMLSKEKEEIEKKR